MGDLQTLIENNLRPLGYELVDFELSAQSKALRVFIDRLDRDAGGIGLDDCEAASDQLSNALAVEDVDYAYLEVSSPGLDRVLKTEAHFARFVGSPVKVKLLRPVGGRTRFEGVIVGCVPGSGRFALRPDPQKDPGGGPRPHSRKSNAKKRAGNSGDSRAAAAPAAQAAPEPARGAAPGAADSVIEIEIANVRRARLRPDV